MPAFDDSPGYVFGTIRTLRIGVGPTCTSVVGMADFNDEKPVAAPAEGRTGPSSHKIRRPVSISARLGRLQFHRSGKFRVLQFTDIQDGPRITADTVKLIEASLDTARPDIVFFTGNQIAGYDAAYTATFRKRRWSAAWPRFTGPRRVGHDEELEHTRALVRESAAQFLAPLIDRGIPWAVTYGNHDFQCGLDPAELDAIYRQFPGCMNAEAVVSQSGRPRCLPDSPLPDQPLYACEPGSLALPVSDLDREHTVIGLVLINSGDYARTGGYGSPSPESLRFLEHLPGMLHARSMLFQHFALHQYYRLLKEVSPTATHAVQGYRRFAGRYYTLDERLIQPGGYLGEGISCPDEDPGEFGILRKHDAYFGVAAGHDHRNGFAGSLDGMLLVATPTCGFGSYGPAPARCASRLFEFDIRHPGNPRTQLLEFGDLVGKPTSRRTYTFAMSEHAQLPGKTMDLLGRPSRFSSMLRWLRGRR